MTLLADSSILEATSRQGYSRQDISTSFGGNAEVSGLDAAVGRNETSISRLLGKQQSEARLRAMEIAKEKNTISSTLLQAKEMRHRNNMNSRIAFEHMDPDGNNLLDMSSVSPLEPSSQRPVAS